MFTYKSPIFIELQKLCFEILTSHYEVTNSSQLQVPATIRIMQKLETIPRNLLFTCFQKHTYRMYSTYYVQHIVLVMMQNRSNDYHFCYFFSLTTSYCTSESLQSFYRQLVTCTHMYAFSSHSLQLKVFFPEIKHSRESTLNFRKSRQS